MIDRYWTIEEGLALCREIANISQQFHCHPALTGGLLYKEGKRKDCDIVIYRRGGEPGQDERPEIDWIGLYSELEKLGLVLRKDLGRCKKFFYRNKWVDILDPTDERHTDYE